MLSVIIQGHTLMPLEITNYMPNEFDKRLRQLNEQRCLAVRRESEVRETALLPVKLRLYDIDSEAVFAELNKSDISNRRRKILKKYLEAHRFEVNQLTPTHFILLDFANSPFINSDRPATLQDALDFIWIVSPEFVANDGEKYLEFIKKHKNADASYLIEEIQEYMQYSMLDFVSPNKNGQDKKSNEAPKYAWIIPYIDLLASQYGWTSDYIMHLPLSLISQFTRVIDERQSIQFGKKATLWNKLSDQVKGDILNLLREKAESEGKLLILPQEE